MFLISLVIFPLISYFLFEKFQKNYKELNGILQLIGLIGLLFIVGLIFFNFYVNSEELLSVIVITYIITFLYYYFKISSIQVKNIGKLTISNGNLNQILLKILFFGFILIFGIYIIDSIDNLFDYNSFEYFIGIFIGLLFIFSTIYQILELLKNKVLTSTLKQNNFRTKLKKELKKEILAEIKINTNI